MLRKLEAHELKFKSYKFHLFQESIEYLSHQVSQEGAQPMKAKICAVQYWVTTHTGQKLQAILGLVGFYQWFIKDFAKVAAPLYTLLMGEEASMIKEFEWNEESKQVFQELKQMLMSAPILAYANYNLGFMLQTDRSLKAGSPDPSPGWSRTSDCLHQKKTMREEEEPGQL